MEWSLTPETSYLIREEEECAGVSRCPRGAARLARSASGMRPNRFRPQE
jgi:hypothetical protein